MPRIRHLEKNNLYLFLMLGLPGSGKSTVAKELAIETDALIIRSDQIMKKFFPNPQFTHEEFQKVISVSLGMMHSSLKQGRSVILDINSNKRSNRKRHQKIGREYSARTITVWVDTPENIAKQRSQSERDEHSFHMSDEFFDQFKSRMQVPNEEEDYIVINGTQDASRQIRDIFYQP